LLVKVSKAAEKWTNSCVGEESGVVGDCEQVRLEAKELVVEGRPMPVREE
jgi:hypothetical protein